MHSSQQFNRLSPDALHQAWQDLRASQPQLRIREAAAKLGVSEAELLATQCGKSVFKLLPEWPTILGSLTESDLLMALTRNDAVVHEKISAYSETTGCDDQYLISGTHLQLCLLLSHWQVGFAVTEDSPIGPRHSLQFFNHAGVAVHKCYLSGNDRLPDFQRMVADFQATDQSQDLVLKSAPETAWRIEQLPPVWQRILICNQMVAQVKPILNQASINLAEFRELMHQLAQLQLPIEITVASPAALQLHQGPIQNLRVTGPWFNVLDEGFNLHLNETAVANIQIVCVQFQQHLLHGLLLRDRQAQIILSLFGEFTEATGECTIWRDFITSLPMPLSQSSALASD
ncbi:MAG: hypothetical protein CTY19_11100 [Methylomonas sp.]|nr:MAG: hypothetical protein CTY19_11100 [Methylomonas sp.]